MKNIKKIAISLILALLIILNISPALAAENLELTKENQKLVISPWAVKSLNDAQVMGIINISTEIMKKDFTEEITTGDIESLNENFSKKLESFNLRPVKIFKPVEIKSDSTRESILLNLYNLIGIYDEKINIDVDPIEYLVKENILKGKDGDYGLKEPTTYEEALTFYTRAITKLYDKKNLGGKGVFYKVQNKGNTVYLFGSIHVGNVDMYPIKADRIKAFNESDELYVELNILDPVLMEEASSYQFKNDGTTLKDEIGEKLYSRVKKVLKEYNVPKKMYDKIEGWALLNTLSYLPIQIDNPYAAALGVDNYFITTALLDNKPIKSLETPKLQMGVLKEYYSHNKEKLLSDIRKALDALENKESVQESLVEMKEMQKIWIEGKPEALTKLFQGDENSKILVETRDPQMAKKIKNLLESDKNKTYFVLVGAGHYAPENSIISYLRNYGFTVQDLNN